MWNYHYIWAMKTRDTDWKWRCSSTLRKMMGLEQSQYWCYLISRLLRKQVLLALSNWEGLSNQNYGFFFFFFKCWDAFTHGLVWKHTWNTLLLLLNFEFLHQINILLDFSPAFLAQNRLDISATPPVWITWFLQKHYFWP